MGLRLLLAVSAVALASCDCPCECSVETQQRLELRRAELRMLGTGTAADEIIRCKPGGECKIPVPVSEVEVVVDGAKVMQCQVQLKYCAICVYGAKASPPIKVTWVLTDVNGNPTQDYEFASYKGINIFYAGITNADFVDPARGNPAQTFTWTAGPRTSGYLRHDAKVRRSGGDKASCVVVDPDIINSN